jgi:hypothetical protein
VANCILIRPALNEPVPTITNDVEVGKIIYKMWNFEEICEMDAMNSEELTTLRT